MPGLHAFPRAARITRKPDFDHVFQKGTKIVGRFFVCHVARRDGQGRKLGMAVSRKVGHAVVRNRIKRFLREYFRTHPDQPGEDLQVVVVARPACSGLDFAACSEALAAQFSKAALALAPKDSEA